jgi:hypothetical protein
MLTKTVLLSIYIQIVQIDFEIGHVSLVRSAAATIYDPPHIHDCKIYLCSADIDVDLSCLIHRCIFNEKINI